MVFRTKKSLGARGSTEERLGVIVPALTACGHATGDIDNMCCQTCYNVEAGMVLSVETTMLHPRRGFIKLEDTVVVTTDGCEMFGERGRGWNRGGRQHPV